MSEGWKPKHNPWAIALTVTIATFMEVLDTSIANVALPHISGTLGAGQSEASWVISSYLVANAVVLPISGSTCKFGISSGTRATQSRCPHLSLISLG